MKLLTLDIETAPNLAYCWGLFNQNIGINQVIQSGVVMCFSAKWADSSKVEFYSTHHDGRDVMVAEAHRLLSEADAVITYNGKRFDLPTLNREFLESGMSPPAPYAQIDLYQVVKKNFKFASNKLDFVVQLLGLGEKTSHTGFQLWVDCIAGQTKAWNLMRKYNKQDVVLTEDLYYVLLPWINNHPAVSLYDDNDELCCTNCGGINLIKRGFESTRVSKFQRYQCKDCGKWVRDSRRIDSTNIRSIS